MAALLRYAIASILILVAIVNSFISPITVYLVRKQSKEYNEITSYKNTTR